MTDFSSTIKEKKQHTIRKLIHMIPYDHMVNVISRIKITDSVIRDID
jgi:hypothetical protein